MRDTGSWVAVFALSLMPYFAAGDVQAQSCRDTTTELQSMDTKQAEIRGPGGERIGLEVHIADSSTERSAGFQHICPDVAEHTAILFVFPDLHVPSFHMRNVHMPLDIAFIDEHGTIRDIQTMQPYVLGRQKQTRYWGPKVPVRAALEVKAGLLQQLGVGVDAWSLPLPE